MGSISFWEIRENVEIMGKLDKDKALVIVRGGGDIATASIYKLHQAGFPVLVLETDRPTAIRWQVAFSQAIYDGETCVEGVICEKINTVKERYQVWEKGHVPILTDPAGCAIESLHPMAVIDGILAKKNLGTGMDMAPLTVALGPGFCAGEDVHAVIETKRGHRLGRIITEGCAAPNTGIPGNIGGYDKERVIHTPCAGILHVKKTIADGVKKGDLIAQIENKDGMQNVYATIDGFIRGMLPDGFEVSEHFKMADIDPRIGERENCFLISDKARCIAGSVLELVCRQWANGYIKFAD